MFDPMQPNISVSPLEMLELARCGCSTAMCGYYTSHFVFYACFVDVMGKHPP